MYATRTRLGNNLHRGLVRIRNRSRYFPVRSLLSFLLQRPSRFGPTQPSSPNGGKPLARKESRRTGLFADYEKASSGGYAKTSGK